jgi:hypothetical protein
LKVVISFILILILFDFAVATHLDDFYEMLENPGTTAFNIKYTQTQFGSVFESFGVCYFIGSGEYFYQSEDLEVYAQVDQIATKNFRTKQVLLNSINNKNISLMTILSGNKKQIEFIDKHDQDFDYYFVVSQLGFDGFFSFNNTTGLIQSLNLNIGQNQLISIEVISIDLIEDFSMPSLNVENFDIIDLRG